MMILESLGYDDVVARIRECGCCAGTVHPADYHAWKSRLAEEFACPVVSKSALHEFADNAYRYHYNLTHDVRKESAGFRMGSMVDTLVLTPHLWGQQYASPWTPSEPLKPKLKKDGSPYANGAQDPEQKERWEREESEFNERCARECITILKPGEEESAREIAGQATRHLAQRGLVPGESYRSQVGLFLFMEELDGVPLPEPLLVTGMIDICPGEGCGESGALWDLKTTSKDPSVRDALFYAVEDYRYGLQAAMYLDLYNACTGQARDSFAFIFVGTQLPAMSCVVRLTAGDLAVFRCDYKALLVRYSMAVASDNWGEAALPDVFYVPTRREAARFTKLLQEG